MGLLGGACYNQGMYPAQTSLIPVQVALARFLEEGGSSWVNYPYWYLGSTPFRYLTGPILPLVLTILHKLLPRLSLFEIIFGLVGIGWPFGSLGVYCLVKEWGGKRARQIGLLAGFFYLFGLLVPFLFPFSDGLSLISFSFLPWALRAYLRFLRSFNFRTVLTFWGWLIFVFLLNMAAIPSLLLGLAVVFLAQVGWKKTEEKLKQTLLVLGLAFLGATFWYTPGFWRVSLFGPSLAGKPRLEVIFQISKLLPIAFALVAATVSVKFFKKKNLLRDFCFYWLFVFGFLTLIRFISDPDFWLDWSSYYVELQMGLAVLGGLVVNTRMKTNSPKADKLRIYANERIAFLGIVVVLVVISWVWVFSRYVVGILQQDISQTVEYGIGRQLSKVAKPHERVFLSGSTVFWLNAFFDIPQVRGGVDQVSVHSTWREAAWEVREGIKVEKSVKALKDLGVSWLVVHSSTSSEYYHDFSYPEKFEKAESLKKVYDEKGDRIYRVLD